MTGNPGPLAIMGGAFDPVHCGHLRTAVEVHEALLDAELLAIVTDDGNAWMLKYEDGDEYRVVFTPPNLPHEVTDLVDCWQ